jgi:hypothetical protein
MVDTRNDLNTGSLTGNKVYALGHAIDLDVHRHALRQPNPSENRVHVGQAQLPARCVSNRDIARNTGDMALQQAAVPHQFHSRTIADVDRSEICLFEIPIHPV